jgi:hypothetical protein
MVRRCFQVVTGGRAGHEVRRAPRSVIFAVSGSCGATRLRACAKLIWEDKATNRRAVLALFEPGAALPRHRHTGENCSTWSRDRQRRSGEVATGNMSIGPTLHAQRKVTQRRDLAAFLWGGIEML